MRSWVELVTAAKATRQSSDEADQNFGAIVVDHLEVAGAGSDAEMITLIWESKSCFECIQFGKQVEVHFHNINDRQGVCFPSARWSAWATRSGAKSG